MPKKVGFFIVGAMRSGTSSLRETLRQNKAINLARGEPRFFVRDELFDKGTQYYHSLFDWDDSILIRGEKTPRYSVSPKVPARIKAYNPDARIVWIFRDPVDRAISHFQHARFRTSSAISLMEAIDTREELESDLESLQSTMAYVYRSEYHKHLAMWSEHFDSDKQHIIVFEELLQAAEQTLKGLHEFLGVPFSPQMKYLRMKNPASDENAKQNVATPKEVSLLADILRPTVDQMETLLGRKLTAWHR